MKRIVSAAVSSLLLVVSAYAAEPSREVRLLKTEAGWSKVRDTSAYFDHAQALLARKLQSQAETALSRKRWAEAISQAEGAQRHWVKIQQRVSSSPWLKRFAEEMGRADLLIGQALAGQKQAARAREAFERGWDRAPFSIATLENVSSYFATCHKVVPNFWKDLTGNSCAGWARRLIAAFPKQSVERQEIGKKWPELVDGLSEILLPAAAPRIHQSYKVSDDDAAAWDAIVPKLREGRLRAVQAPLREFLEMFPRSTLRQKARYWLGISQLEDGEVPEDVRPLFERVAQESPLSFYGLLSARQLGKNPEDFLSSEEPVEKPVDLRLHPSELLALRKAEALLQAGDPALAELAQMELREIRPKETHESEFLVRLANLNRQAGSHLGAFAVVTELIQRGAKQATTQWAARIIFPIERWKLVLENSDSLRIDPVWVLSLMKQESAFDVGALSSSGAVGLMQVMPATAVDTDPKITRVALSEHAANIRVGTTYMAQMLQRFRGNIALATAAYNAGPVAVERWMREFGMKDVENGLSLGIVEFIESIPYKETRDYVGSIIRNYHWYSRRLPQEVRQLPKSIAGPQPLQYFWVRNLPATSASASSESSQK
jgi:soluble lytic murein transglycosylase-like protein